jgi:hypothetical protein
MQTDAQQPHGSRQQVDCAIVTFAATGGFDDRRVNACTFFEDHAALFENFDCFVKQCGDMAVLAK